MSEQGPKRPPKKLSTYQSTLAQIKEIENDPKVKGLISEKLPPNYDFEIGKTIWRIRSMKGRCRTVALQFPEGLLIFSTRIGSILTELTAVDVILMGDITYGACCIDDYTASMLGADLLVHYGHSCLVPTMVANRLETIYIFVTIRFSVETAVRSICGVINEFMGGGDPVVKTRTGKIEYEDSTKPLHVCLISTIQFAQSLGEVKAGVEAGLGGLVEVEVPRSKPLSKGEVLGCTAPRVDGAGLIVYVGDGRFHLEAMMMANPGVVAYRYDPYNTTTTLESFDHASLTTSRSASLSKLIQSTTTGTPTPIGLILGTLGRQGNPIPTHYLYDKMKSTGLLNPFIILMSEVMPAKLELFRGRVSGWVQFACPRLSIDWGESFSVPVLTSFEGVVVCDHLVKGDYGRSGTGGDCCRRHGDVKEDDRCGSGDCCHGDVKGDVRCGSSDCCHGDVKEDDRCGSGDCCRHRHSDDDKKPYYYYTHHPMDYYAYDSSGAHTPNFGGGVILRNK